MQGSDFWGSVKVLAEFPKLDKIPWTVEYQGTTKNGFVIENIDGLTYIDGYLIVNKTYSLPETYRCSDSVNPIWSKTDCMNCIQKHVSQSFEKMKSDAKQEGVSLFIVSGFRSYSRQKNLYNAYVMRDGKKSADTYSARPWYSEHQTSLAFDLNSVTNAFANTKEGKWLNEHAYQYGFILRYPKGKEKITGYMYEPWHFRYVGQYLAAKLRNQGDWISLEEYFWIDSAYSV